MTVIKGVFPLLVAMLSSGSVAANFDQQHSAWTDVLQKYVQNDRAVSYVDYVGLKENRRQLDSYLESLSAVSESEYAGWTKSQQLAFLINAYNAFTVKLIVDNYPVDSIKDLGGWFSSPWKKEFFTLLGAERHLDDIEHGMIRENFREPRIHFAVNCASKGCPPLRREAYVAERLDEQLEDNTRIFLQDRRRNRYIASESLLEVSPLFNWYAEDFVETAGSIEAFIAPRITDESAVAGTIQHGDFSVRFLGYDWSLNER